MRLMRNTTPDGQCKYALVRMDKLAGPDTGEGILARAALASLQRLGLLENPKPGDEDEFFVIKLKDENARSPLVEYALCAHKSDQELSRDVMELADRAGFKSPFCKKPD